MKLRVVPYKPGSNSARLLAESLSELVGYKVYRGLPKLNRIHIPWGYPMTEGIENARNKLSTFKILDGKVPIPPYTTDIEKAKEWINEGRTVFCRKSLTGHSGFGIVMAESIDQLVDAPLYVQYIKKKQEFRVHVVGEQIIAIQEKRKRIGVEHNGKIRNLANGWVYCNNGIIELADDAKTMGRTSTSGLGLSLGAADIIWNEVKKQAFVLEVNTAPGLCPTTARKYAEAIVNQL